MGRRREKGGGSGEGEGKGEEKGEGKGRGRGKIREGGTISQVYPLSNFRII